jgi:flavin-dependent dehydrogenase
MHGSGAPLSYSRSAMPARATKRGPERTPLKGSYDVLVCGASFAGLTVARELAGCGARVLVVDRYEIGERQTSACAAPTAWLTNLGLEPSIKQTFGDLVIHTPHTTVRMNLPWSFSTFDYRTLCGLLWGQCDAEFETATVEGRAAPANGDGSVRVATDRGELAAPLVVDALGWRRALGAGANVQPPEARLSRGLEVHPWGSDEDLEIWIERGVVPAGYGWSFPAAEELRVGVGSFDPRFAVKQPTVQLAERLELPSLRYQGNWIPHRLRPAVDSGIFFVGDSAGHCLPLTAEGIRTAFYFAIACGRELRAVHAGAMSRQQALWRYAAFSDAHRWKFEAMLRAQQLIPRLPPRLLALALRGMATKRFVDWAFGHYLRVAPPEFARHGIAAASPSMARVAG